MRSWLYRIATNQCLNARRAAGRRVPAEPVPPFQPPEPTSRGEITWLQPYPDSLLDGIGDAAPGPEARYRAVEAIELAFIAGLQRMPPRQAAALLLRDVLGFAAAEVAEPARHHADRRQGQLAAGPRGGAPRPGSACPRPGTAAERALARRFADAYVAADIGGVVALLTDDAWLSMPPAPHQYQGPAAIGSFLQASFGYRGGRRVVLVPTSANTQPALASYLASPDEEARPGASPAGLFVLTMAGPRIRAITRFHCDALYPRFGLPLWLPATAAQPAR